MQVMYTGAEYSNQDLFGEIRETALREGVSSVAQFRDLIDELVEEKQSYGFFSQEEDLTQIKENLERRWPEVEKIVINRIGEPIH